MKRQKMQVSRQRFQHKNVLLTTFYNRTLVFFRIGTNCGNQEKLIISVDVILHLAHTDEANLFTYVSTVHMFLEVEKWLILHNF